MFNPSRDQARQFFFDTWNKYKERQPLAGLETTVLEVLLQHPEYHALLDDAERFRERDYLPEAGETNPFLHLSLHIAIQEQLSIDQPVGVAGHYQRILKKCKEPHDAQHALMECLAEMIWQSQRNQTPPDSGVYLRCLEQKTQR